MLPTNPFLHLHKALSKSQCTHGITPALDKSNFLFNFIKVLISNKRLQSAVNGVDFCFSHLVDEFCIVLIVNSVQS